MKFSMGIEEGWIYTATEFCDDQTGKQSSVLRKWQLGSTAACSASVINHKKDSKPKHTLLLAQWTDLDENFYGHRGKVELCCHEIL